MRYQDGHLSQPLQRELRSATDAALQTKNLATRSPFFIDLLSLGRRLDWAELTEVLRRTDSAKAAGEYAHLARVAPDQRPLIYAAALFSDSADRVAGYLIQFGKAGLEDLKLALGCGDPPESRPRAMLVGGPKRSSGRERQKTRDGTEGPDLAGVRWRQERRGSEQGHNISEVTFHRWKRQFGQLDVNEVKRMKELERENAELKKMLADSLLRNRVLEAVNAKNAEPGAQATDGRLHR